MAKKPLTAQQVSQIDWTSLLAKFPAFAALLGQLIALLMSGAPPKTAAAPGEECCDEVKGLCKDECAALCALIAVHCKLHEAICCDPPVPDTKPA